MRPFTEPSRNCASGFHESEDFVVLLDTHNTYNGIYMGLEVCKHCRCVYVPRENEVKA